MGVTFGNGQVALRDTNLAFGVGVTGLLGPNGAGKSTLIRVLASGLRPTQGTVTVDGCTIKSERNARAARRQIGYLPQTPGLIGSFTVREVVTYIGWLRGLDGAQLAEAVPRAIDEVGLTDVAGRKTRRLSGGMHERAAMACALVGRPQILLLDEPTVGLDPQQRIKSRQLVRSLADRCVVLSTHLVEDIQATCDRLLVLHEGTVVFDGTVEELAARAPAGRDVSPLEAGYVAVLDDRSGQ